MNVRDVADTLILWRCSCITLEQVGLIDSLIEPYLINRFRGDVDLTHQTTRVLMAIQMRSQQLTKSTLTELNMN